MLKAVYDHQIFSCQQYGGISRYFAMLAEYVAKISNVSAQVMAKEYVAEAVEAMPSCVKQLADVRKSSIAKTGKRLDAGRKAVRHTLQGLEKAMMPDVVHETYFTHQSPVWNGGATVITIHDMNHEKYPQFCHPNDTTAHFKKAALSWADGIICISEATRNDLLTMTDVDPKRVAVVHHGVAPLGGAPLAEVAPAKNDAPPHPTPYILFVGHRAGYKDFPTLVRTLGLARFAKDVDLVCVGGGALTAEEMKLIRQCGLDTERVFQTTCSDERLAEYYCHAQTFVFPSISEGFGLPVLEAMQYGCPVICANAGAFPEVGGRAALYFHPSEPDDLARCLEQIVFSPALQKERGDAGILHARNFSWESCAGKTVQAYRAALEHRRT